MERKISDILLRRWESLILLYLRRTIKRAILMPATYTFKFVNVQPVRLCRATTFARCIFEGNFLAIGSEWFYYTRISMSVCSARAMEYRHYVKINP